MTHFRSRIALLLLIPVVMAGSRLEQKILPTSSSLEVTFTQMSIPVDGRFTRFNGDFTYHPDQAADSSVRLKVETGSFDLGDTDYNAEVRKPEWFDSKSFPNAVFESESISAGGADQFSVRGELSLKGTRKMLEFDVAVSKSPDGDAMFSGTVPISRKAFSIGDAEWDEVLEDEVLIKFNIKGG